MGKAIETPREIIGYVACPICGAQHQRVKINKSGNLYIYCENRCATRFSPKASDEIIANLRQGKKFYLGSQIIYPASTKNEEVEKPAQSKVIEIKEVKDNGKRGNSTDGRPNRELATSSGSPEQQRPAERFASWLWGDDDIA